MQQMELKNEYLSIMCGYLSVPIFQGISSIYEAAVEHKKKTGSSVQDLRIFQDLLRSVVPSWSASILEREVKRIKTLCKQDGILENLFRAVLKSSILIQTGASSFSKTVYVKRRHYEDASFDLYVHKCYVLCAREFYNYPFLFTRVGDPLTIKNNQREAMKIISDCVRSAVRHFLPMREILAEYLEEPLDKKKVFSNTVSLLADDGSNVVDRVFSTYNIKESVPVLLTNGENNKLSPIAESNNNQEEVAKNNEVTDEPAQDTQATLNAKIENEKSSNEVHLSRHSLTNFLMEDPKLIRSESIDQSPLADD